MFVAKLYRWAISAAIAVGAFFTIYFQRKTINRQAEKIKDTEKVIKVKAAVHEVNKQSEIEARENINEITKDAESMHDYLTGKRVRNDKD